MSNPAWRPLYNRIWDVTDIIVPPVENNAFFITTNIVITPNQARGECAERAAVAPCRTGTDCPAGRAASNLGSGVNTGVCNTTTGSCQVYAWCPLGKTLKRCAWVLCLFPWEMVWFISGRIKIKKACQNPLVK